jgi:CRISPR/Cas system-associated protein Cas10 (large subunit of type III CRISPR-Cas system)
MPVGTEPPKPAEGLENMDTAFRQPVNTLALRPTEAEYGEHCTLCARTVRVGESCYERRGRVGYVCAACVDRRSIQVKPPQPRDLLL